MKRLSQTQAYKGLSLRKTTRRVIRRATSELVDKISGFANRKAMACISLLLFILLGICACKPKSCPQLLIAGDSLASKGPDSATSLLKNIDQANKSNIHAIAASFYYAANKADSAIFYNYQLYEKENLRLKAENHQEILLLWFISTCLIIGIISFITYHQYNKRKNLNLEQQLDKLRAIEKENREKIEFLERYQSQKEELEKNLANINVYENSEQKNN